MFQINLINCAKLRMKSFRQSPSDSHTKKEQEGRLVKTVALSVNSQPLSPIVLKNESQNESGGQQKRKASMESLCNIFLQTVVASHSPKFQIKDLTSSTQVPQRRGYDLMNILQGCGFVKHLSKGTYLYKGFQAPDEGQLEQKGKKESALRNLARRVKLSLMEHSQQVEFKQLCDRLIEQNSHLSLNPASIKRRVYECCKVLKVLGLIEKQGQKFKWTSKYKQKLNELNIQASQQKSHFQTKTKVKQDNKGFMPLSQNSQTSSLVSRLIETISTEEELNSTIRELRHQFMKRMEEGAVSRKLKFQ